MPSLRMQGKLIVREAHGHEGVGTVEKAKALQ